MAADQEEKLNNNEVLPQNKSKSKKKLIIILALLLILIIAGLGYYFLKKKSASNLDEKKTENSAEHNKHDTTNISKSSVYYDLEEFVVNLAKVDKQTNFLKMSITLQVVDQIMLEKIKLKLPLIRDAFQIYLRDLRIDDLQGSAAIYRLKEELLLRLSIILQPDKIEDVLFKEILVQ